MTYETQVKSFHELKVGYQLSTSKENENEFVECHHLQSRSDDSRSQLRMSTRVENHSEKFGAFLISFV